MTKSLKGSAWIIVALIIAASFAVRYYSAVTRDRYLSYDEMVYVKLAMQLKENVANYNPQSALRFLKWHLPDYRRRGYEAPGYMAQPLFKHPPLYFYTLASSFFLKLYPYPFAAGFLVSILCSMLTIVVTFLIARRFYDDRVAVLASFFLAIDPESWLCSIRIWLESATALWVVLALLCFFRLRQKTAYGFWTGACAGLGLLTKYTAGILFPIFIFYAVFYESSLLAKKRFWAIFITAAAFFSPWFFWNWRVYGEEFLIGIRGISAEGRFFSWHAYLFLYGGLLFALLVCLRFRAAARPAAPEWSERRLGSRIFFEPLKFLMPAGIAVAIFGKTGHGYAWPLQTKWLILAGMFLTGALFLRLFSKDPARAGKLILPAIVIGYLAALISESSFWPSIWNSLSYGYVPEIGWTGDFFLNRRWFFYFERLLQFSPLYFLSFASICYFSSGDRREDALLILSGMGVVIAATLWGVEYQSRYVLPAVPLFLLLARLLVFLWDRARGFPPAGTRVFRFFLVVAVLFSVAKTLNMDTQLVFFSSVHMCYF